MLFRFKLTDGSIVEDIEGLELSDLDAAGTGQTGRSLSRTIRVSRSFGCPFLRIARAVKCHVATCTRFAGDGARFNFESFPVGTVDDTPAWT
jgi:hypothetical protein